MLQFADAESDRSKVVSALAQVEARSGIARMRSGKLITASEASSALDALGAELRKLVEQPVNPPVLDAAKVAIDRYSLRAMDAMQLGSAIVARDLLASPEMRFIASDQALLNAAQAEGFAIWDPLANG